MAAVELFYKKMPVIEIKLWKGKLDTEKKEKLIESISKDVSDVVGCPVDACDVIITEVERENWGRGGVQSSKIDK